MKARTINAMAWAVIALALAGHTLAQSWDGVTMACTILGHLVLCAAIFFSIDNIIKKGSEQ